MPLTTTFEVAVDGTNGNTELKPVRARLGKTNFVTSGTVIKHEGDTRKSIVLDAHMPAGNLPDLLRLAMKGAPFMEGTIKLDTRIEIPPLSGKVREKLMLDGTFDVTNGKFLRSTIQDQIDGLSRKGQGKPNNQEIDEVVSRMSGDFHMDDQVLLFRTLAFSVMGAAVNVNGTYDIGHDTLDIHGALSLDAKVSQTQTGWKRWVLKPVDPFFAKNGVGTFLKIKIAGPAKKPSFGLDR
ncbi:MAG: AsmA-like C-terminal region-containing protein [Acidobacteriota bacterium]